MVAQNPIFPFSLLQEAQPLEKRAMEMGESMEGAMGGQTMEADDVEDEELDERRLLSRYGIWLMVELCSPTEKTPIVSFTPCFLSIH